MSAVASFGWAHFIFVQQISKENASNGRNNNNKKKERKKRNTVTSMTLFTTSDAYICSYRSRLFRHVLHGH